MQVCPSDVVISVFIPEGSFSLEEGEEKRKRIKITLGTRLVIRLWLVKNCRSQIENGAEYQEFKLSKVLIF